MFAANDAINAATDDVVVTYSCGHVDLDDDLGGRPHPADDLVLTGETHGLKTRQSEIEFTFRTPVHCMLGSRVATMVLTPCPYDPTNAGYGGGYSLCCLHDLF